MTTIVNSSHTDPKAPVNVSKTGGHSVCRPPSVSSYKEGFARTGRGPTGVDDTFEQSSSTFCRVSMLLGIFWN